MGGAAQDVRPWVAMTMSGSPRNPDVDGKLLPLFPHTVEVPALRHRIEDINDLVPKILGRLTKGGNLTCSPAALRQLMRLPWMGNVEQLRQVLSRVVQQRRAGTIELEDLPPGCNASSRRQLSQLESLERDAIVTALIANSDNKVNAAKDLGMSRATIYRKIRDYGIAVSPLRSGHTVILVTFIRAFLPIYRRSEHGDSRHEPNYCRINTSRTRGCGTPRGAIRPTGG